jgi:signal transduction histidine kinase
LDRAGISPFHHLLAIRRRNAADTLYVISKAISKSSNIDDILFKIATSLGVFTNLERSSIILVDRDMKKGKIAASFEGKHLRNLEIDIAKYPEIKKALEEDKIITIENIMKSPVMQGVVSDLSPLQNQSIMVIPVSTREEQLGVLFLRGHRGNKGFTKEEIRFCETVATTSAQALMNVRMNEELSESANEKQKMIEKLGKMNIELEEANKLKSIFLANVSHELRTPLTSIIGYLQILAEQEISTVEGIKYVDTIKSNSETLLRLINGLIDISKIESGTFELFYEKAHLNEIIEYICDIFSPTFDKEGIICNLRLQRFNTPFYFDVNRIEQVLSNLLSNAVKFSPTGQKIVIKSAFAEKWAEVTIKDDGIGIDEKNQKVIFQRFTQVDSSRSREHEGSGIGLHLCHEITKRHGGKIWVKSKPGKGSVFKFRIPMITSEEDLAKWLDKSTP